MIIYEEDLIQVKSFQLRVLFVKIMVDKKY